MTEAHRVAELVFEHAGRQVATDEIMPLGVAIGDARSRRIAEREFLVHDRGPGRHAGRLRRFFHALTQRR